MPANFHSSPRVASANTNSYVSKLLIPRSQRRIFFLQFTLMTLMGWVVGGIASIALEKVLWESLPNAFASAPETWSFWVKLLSNVVFAVVFAADQALVIRRYISGRLWLLATSIGWLIAHSVATGWNNYISSIATSLKESLTLEITFILAFLSTFLYIFSGIWLGLFQWLVLRRYTAKSWWWSFFPSISFLCISVLVWLLSLGQNLFPENYRTPILYWSQQGFTAIILGIIPAIGLCSLRRKSHRKIGITSSS
ncbi:hypothetical protein ACN23B_19630 [Anabaena sp. FACHB-709]|uniref:Uncharacterized protein n=2 Tax=Nostocaceae TaxID=1162 RepID=A0A1Z4KKP3_ANAVA|nr:MULTISPECIES: hypothetical protein [Nostocaceae]BAY69535.1 hypothetical protein NIES23_23290 [Trichormus variabilis NIES-23]MBD2170999.1 hypothetical protein [Anabaena cylindrica FACHB-318]MBD2262779.1 hypothetical protein [Anabaena sp. FACHB-709]MBD2272423.1 hypothetical protein [Nostoc sp. PCC 7120 = FACHB-418]MBD2283378.1 hypothetical protein [Anabaena cylindrica FACHB-170]